MIDGSTDPDCGDNGIPLVDDDFVILINGWWEPLTFTTPADVSKRSWQILCDTFDPTRSGAADDHMQVGPRSLIILQSSA
jgi:isoamylase